MISYLKGELEIIIPAKNAPSESENPKYLLKYAEPRIIKNTEPTKISSVFIFALERRAILATNLPGIMSNKTTTIADIPVFNSISMGLKFVLLKSLMSNKIGITAMSWNTRIPTQAVP